MGNMSSPCGQQERAAQPPAAASSLARSVREARLCLRLRLRLRLRSSTILWEAQRRDRGPSDGGRSRGLSLGRGPCSPSRRSSAPVLLLLLLLLLQSCRSARRRRRICCSPLLLLSARGQRRGHAAIHMPVCLRGGHCAMALAGRLFDGSALAARCALLPLPRLLLCTSRRRQRRRA